MHLRLADAEEQEDLEELRLLAISAGATIVGVVEGARQQPDSATYVGSGKAEEVRALVASTGAELVLVNAALSPGQERNLEKVVSARVLDRTGLILDIFAQRAHSHEGKLQGQIESFDQFVVLLKNTVSQMIYKHAISTVVPSRPVKFTFDMDETDKGVGNE